MKKYHVLYNPRSSGNRGLDRVRTLETKLPEGTFTYHDVTQVPDMIAHLAGIPEDVEVIFAGGDGTLNNLVNQIAGRELPRELFYYPIGSGNDFAADIGEKPETRLISLNRYIAELPSVDFGGKKRYFVNGVGCGLDGYCCAEGARRSKVSEKPVNYTAVALRGLLFDYKPGNAKITVDGVVHTYERVWLAPTMYGRYFGGGMMIAPPQDRNDPEQTLTVIVVHSAGRLRMLTAFPRIFKGTHMKLKKMIDVLHGRDVTVEFDKPTAMQVDGETLEAGMSCRSRAPGR